MKWIEFIGPSGVGKSYLFEKLLDTRTSKEWISQEEGLEMVKNKLIDDKKIRIDKRFITLAKKFYTRGKRNSFQQIPSSYIKKAADKYGSSFNFLSEMMIREYATVSALEPWKKLKMISWYYNKRLLPFIVLYAAELNQTVVFEDGIFHNSSLLNLAKYCEEIDTEGQVIYPDAIICVMADPETIIERIKMRNRATGGTFIQKNFTDFQIRKHVKSSLNKHREIVDFLNRSDRKVLEIDATIGVSENCEYINRFIGDLNKPT